MMRLVIDTNRLIAGLLKLSTSRQIILADQFDFYAPDYILLEIGKYRGYLLKKAGLNPSGFDRIFNILMEEITLVHFEEFRSEFDRAMKIMETVDVKDTTFLAVGMSIQADGIWTEDKDFLRQDLLKVYVTTDLLRMINLD